MSTIVCQNLVSCFESQLTETTTTLKLKVAPPLPTAAVDFCMKLPNEDDKSLEFGNWGFLQTFPAKSGDHMESFPARNSSFSRLSPKSLQICTENLGSETGSDTVSDGGSIFSSPPLSPSSNSVENLETVDEFNDWKQKPRSPHHKEAISCRKAIGNFPPPLTTMSGSSSLQVRRHREGGRLIIEAVEAPFRNSFLQAERRDGRLKLCFLKSSDEAATTTSADEEEEEEECGGEKGVDEEIEDSTNDESEKEAFNGEINIEMGKENFQRLSRCKEGGHGSKGLCNNCWVS